MTPLEKAAKAAYETLAMRQRMVALLPERLTWAEQSAVTQRDWIESMREAVGSLVDSVMEMSRQEIKDE